MRDALRVGDDVVDVAGVVRADLDRFLFGPDDVVRLAAKRPTYPDVQEEIAKSERWSVRPRVRLALAQNPYTPTSLSVPTLPLLMRHQIDEIAHSPELPSVVRAAALDLLDRRPPVPASDDPREH